MAKKATALFLILQLWCLQSVFAQTAPHSDWDDGSDAARTSPTHTVFSDQESFNRNAALLSLYEKISLLELDVFGKTSPHKAAGDRLAELEKSVFENTDPANGSALERVARLLSALKPSNELVCMVVVKATSKPGWSFKSVSAPWVNSAAQQVSLMEIQLLGKSNPDAALIDRVKQLQKLVLPSGVVPATDIGDQIASLMSLVAPSQKALDKAMVIANSHAGWFWNPPQIHWIGSVGRGAKHFGRSVGDSTKAVASSPTFWMLLLGAGAVTALYFAERGANGNGQPVPAYIASERGCTGMLNCPYCTNCRYCHYCNESYDQNFCGIKLRIMRYGQ